MTPLITGVRNYLSLVFLYWDQEYEVPWYQIILLFVMFIMINYVLIFNNLMKLSLWVPKWSFILFPRTKYTSSQSVLFGRIRFAPWLRVRHNQLPYFSLSIKVRLLAVHNSGIQDFSTHENFFTFSSVIEPRDICTVPYITLFWFLFYSPVWHIL